MRIGAALLLLRSPLDLIVSSHTPRWVFASSGFSLAAVSVTFLLLIRTSDLSPGVRRLLSCTAGVAAILAVVRAVYQSWAVPISDAISVSLQELIVANCYLSGALDIAGIVLGIAALRRVRSFDNPFSALGRRYFSLLTGFVVLLFLGNFGLMVVNYNAF